MGSCSAKLDFDDDSYFDIKVTQKYEPEKMDKQIITLAAHRKEYNKKGKKRIDNLVRTYVREADCKLAEPAAT